MNQSPMILTFGLALETDIKKKKKAMLTKGVYRSGSLTFRNCSYVTVTRTYFTDMWAVGFAQVFL